MRMPWTSSRGSVLLSRESESIHLISTPTPVFPVMCVNVSLWLMYASWSSVYLPTTAIFTHSLGCSRFFLKSAQVSL